MNANAHSHSHSHSTNRKQQQHQQQFTRKLIDTQSVCECVSLLCNSTKSFECTNFTWPLLYWLSRMCMAVWEKEMKTCSSQCYSSKTMEFCVNCVCIGAKLQQSCPLRNVVKTTPALAAAAAATKMRANKMKVENGTLETICSFVIVIEDFGLVNKYDPLHCSFLRFCFVSYFVSIFTFYPWSKKMSSEFSGDDHRL